MRDTAVPDDAEGLFSPGTTVDNRFRIVESLADTERGHLYEAEHLFLHQTLALRILSDENDADGRLEELFLEETRLLAALTHPSLVRLYDVGVTSSGYWFATMERLAGKSLKAWIDTDGPRLRKNLDRLGDDGIWDHLREIADGLQEVHDNGHCHLNLTPSTIILHRTRRSDGTEKIVPKVTDFGRLGSVAEESRGANPYLSPELRQGEVGGVESDIFSFAVILYELLTGALPYADSGRLTAATTHHPALPPEVDAVFVKALDEQRERRFDSVGDLLSALEDALSVFPDDMPSEGVAVGAAAPSKSGRQLYVVGFASVLVIVTVLGVLGWRLSHRSADGQAVAEMKTGGIAIVSEGDAKSAAPRRAVEESVSDAEESVVEVLPPTAIIDDGVDAGVDDDMAMAAASVDGVVPMATEEPDSEVGESLETPSEESSKLKLSPKEKDRMRYCIKKARVAVRDRQWEAAKTAFEEAVSINPSRADAWFGLARIEYETKAYAAAVKHAHQALELTDRASWRLRYGEFLLKNGQNAEAAAAWKKVLHGYPTVRPGIADEAKRRLKDLGVDPK